MVSSLSHRDVVQARSYLGCLNEFIDEVHRMVAVVGLAHHLGNTVGTDSIICITTVTEDKSSFTVLESRTYTDTLTATKERRPRDLFLPQANMLSNQEQNTKKHLCVF